MVKITEHKIDEELLSQSRRRLLRGESVSRSGNWELHLETGVITSSEGARRLYGLEGEKWSFDAVKDIPLPEYRALLDNALTQLVKNGIPYDIEFKIKHQLSGQIIDIHSIAEYDPNKKVLFGVIQDISDQKKAEEALFKSEERFRSLFEGSPDAIFLADSETGLIIDVNRAAGRLTGRSIDELIGIHQSKLHPTRESSRSRETFNEHVVKTRQNENAYLLENYVINSDGSEIPVEILASSITLNGKEVIQGVFRDISEQKRTLGKLKMSERTLTNLISNLPGFVYRCKNDKLWTMEYLSEGFCTITGYSVDEIMDLKELSYNDIIHPDYRNYLWDKWQVCLADRSPLEEEYPIIARNGEVRWVWERGRGVYDDNDLLVFLEGFISDITDRKRNEQIQKILYDISTAVPTTQNLGELIEIIRNQLGKLLDTSNFYVAFYDEVTGMCYTPHAVDQKDSLSSWPAEKSMTGYLIRHKKALLVSAENIIDLIDSGEIQMVGTPAKLWLGVPLHEDEKIIGAFVVQSYDNPTAYTVKDLEMLEFISHQISLFVQRKRADGKLKTALVKAEESDRLKSAFLATMNHELRTPLNHILGFSELILSGVMPEDNQSFASSIYTSGKNLLSIVEDVFNLALAEQSNVKLRLQTFRLMDQFMENKASFDHLLQSSGKAEQIQLIFKPDTRLLSMYVTVDRSKVNQILINLFKNAVKFTNQGTIEYGYQQIETGKLTFFIKDTGIGIAREKQSVIFDFFRQGDDSATRVYGGIGIGLAIALKITQILKGELSVVSKPDQGSTFYLTVPVELAEVNN